MSEFYKLRYDVMEAFYEYIVEENYTVGQAADRCLYEYGEQVSGGGLEALAVYSTLLYRTACHAPDTLKIFQKQIKALDALLASDLRHAFSEDAFAELTDELDMIHQKLSQAI